MKGKAALVTGSTSGIGLSIATCLAENGYNVMLNGLGEKEEIEGIRSRLESHHSVKVLYSDANMLDPDAIEQMVEMTVNDLGSIDILVNNAGIQYVSPIDTFPSDKWNEIIAINLSAPFFAIRKALGFMKERKWGRIVNIASAHALVASPYKSAYVASKHGLLGLTKAIALEIAIDGITCNAICPGYVLTDLVKGQIKDQAKAKNISEEDVIDKVMLAMQPTKAFVAPEDIGHLVLFLISEAGKSITGSALPIDGGWSAH